MMKNWRFISILLLAIVWLGYLILGEACARWAQGHFGHAITLASSGEIHDVSGFVLGLLQNAAWLVTAVVLLAWAQVLLAWVFLKTSTGRNKVWAFHSLALFASINIWLLAASHTGLFWCALFQGYEGGGENFGPFQIKKYFLKTSKQDLKIVIMGNSQANRQFKRQLFDQIFSSQVFTEDQHWPGSSAYDVMLVHRHSDPADAQIILCYVSEISFYSGSDSAGDSLPLFFGFSDFSDFQDISLISHVPVRKVCYGLIGDVIPVFRFRDPLSQRFLGKAIFGIKQRAVNAHLGVGLDTEARRVADKMAMGADSEFQKKAFTVFVERCARQKQKLIIMAGQLNPVLGGILPTEMRADMLLFLRSLRDRYPCVLLMDDLPFQDSSCYVDLTHVKSDQREVFTRYTAARLVKLCVVPPLGEHN